MFVIFVSEHSHLFYDQGSNFFFIGQELFFAYLQVVVLSLKIDKGLRQCRDWFPENLIKGIPVIGIDTTLKIEEREEQIVDAFFNTHSHCSIMRHLLAGCSGLSSVPYVSSISGNCIGPRCEGIIDAAQS
jgi:hypothetical protein